jgi:chromosome segregation ATPase
MAQVEAIRQLEAENRALHSQVRELEAKLGASERQRYDMVNQAQARITALEDQANYWQMSFEESKNIRAELQRRITQLENDLADALDLKNGVGPTVLTAMKKRIEQLEGALKRCMDALGPDRVPTDRKDAIRQAQALIPGVYREWCRDPKLCQDKGTCPKDPTCSD